MLLGAHVSIAGGIHRAIGRGTQLGCRAIQIFTKSARQWSALPIDGGTASAFRQARAESDIRTVIVHDSYLINLAARDQGLWERSVEAFITEVSRAELIGADHIIMHPGHYGEGSEKEGLERVVEALGRTRDVLGSTHVRVLVENTAGAGRGLGGPFTHVGAILDEVGDGLKAGACFDTCHGFAAGHDIATDHDGVFDRYDSEVGLNRLWAIHLNDSMFEAGSGTDRHAVIGQGQIGIEAFERLVNDRRFTDIPGILETPSPDDGANDHAHQLARLGGLVGPRDSREGQI